MALDLSARTPPPGATRRQNASPAATRVAAAQTEARREGIDGFFKLASFGLLMAGQPADAGAIAMHSPPISEEAAKLAESNAQVAKVVDWLTAVGPMAGLLSACIPLALQLFVNHKPGIPADAFAQFGVYDPATMEAKANAEAARAAAAMVEDQTQAQVELVQAQARAQEAVRAAQAEAQAAHDAPQGQGSAAA